MNLRILQGIYVAALVSGGLFGQAAGSRPGGTGGINSSSPTIGRSPSSTQPTTTQPNTTIPDIQRPMYISGKVVLNDGQPPPESVVLQLICNASPRSVGYTDTKGRFSIDLGNRNNSAIFGDASQDTFGRPGSNGTSQAGRVNGANSGGGSLAGVSSLAGCDLQAALPGFRSDRVNLSNRHSLDNPEVGTIILHRLGNVEGLTISATSALAPNNAKKAYEKGRNEAKKEKWDNAERELLKAVDVYPKYAAAWYELGLVQEHLNKGDAAHKSYSDAVACDSKFVSPRMQLALMAVREKNWEEVESSTKQLLKLNPVDFPQAWYYNSLANFQLKKMDAAEKSATDGLTADTQHTVPRLDQVLGIILANKGDYPGAQQHLRAYLMRSPDAPDGDTVRKQLAQIEKAMPQAATKPPEER